MLTETDYMVVSGTTDTASVTSDSYNSAGQLLYSVNGVGDTTAYSYDADGNTVQEVDGYGTTDSATTQYQYDLAGGQTAIIDPAGDTTNFSLNADGQMVGMTEDLGTSTSSEAYTYNLAGQLVTTIDENGGTEAYVNDADGRVTSETWYNSGGTAVESFSYSYDKAGNMLTAMNTQGTDTFSYSFTYNAAGEVLTVSEPFGVSLSFGYNLAGERTTVSDSFGGSESLTYDADGDLTSLTYNVSGSTVSMNFTYNQAGQQTQESMYYNFGLIATVSESYDADGDVLKIVDTNTSAATIDSFSYAYDLANEVTTESDYSGASTSYSYNAAGELINAGTQTYNYDAAGDADSTGDTSSGGNEQTSFVDPATGDTLDYTYDNAGNELTKTDTNTGTTWTYGYNNANQVVTATETNSLSVTQEVVNYEYDAFGNLLKETTTPYVSGVAGSSTVTEFAVDGWNPAKSQAMGDSGFDTWAVMNGSGALQTRNLIGNQIDQILARVDNATNGASDPSGVYFTLTDKDGSVRDVLNSTANAAPVDVISYDAWGNILSQTSTNGSVTTPSDYLGHYSWDGYDYDTADSLYLDHARIYDAASQRWMSQDPMGYDAGDSNLYRYVNNAPTNATDPSGKSSANENELAKGDPQIAAILKDQNAKMKSFVEKQQKAYFGRRVLIEGVIPPLNCKMGRLYVEFEIAHLQEFFNFERNFKEAFDARSKFMLENWSKDVAAAYATYRDSTPKEKQMSPQNYISLYRTAVADGFDVYLKVAFTSFVSHALEPEPNKTWLRGKYIRIIKNEIAHVFTGVGEFLEQHKVAIGQVAKGVAVASLLKSLTEMKYDTNSGKFSGGIFFMAEFKLGPKE